MSKKWTYLLSALLILALMLAACGGGAETTDNPINPGGGTSNNAPYTGPVARDASVLAFQQEFWANAKTTDRCGSCHNESIGQQPMFVRNDDVNMAYDAGWNAVATYTEVDVDEVSAEDAMLYAAPMSHGAGIYNFMFVLRGARHVDAQR